MTESIEYAAIAQPLSPDVHREHAEHAQHAQHAHAQHAHAEAAPRSAARKTVAFIWHFVQMTVAMMLGMIVFGALLGTVVRPLGFGAAFARGTALNNIGMGIAMALPMVVWMLRRGHGWRLSIEMVAAMLAPLAAGYLFYAFGANAIGAGLIRASHPGMFLGMLAAMLLRREYYTH